jgi:class 3 adenylate cyclase
MLRAVRRIAEAGTSFPLKIGVNRGHVFAGEIGTEFRSTYTVMGDTVNLAARLMAAAPAARSTPLPRCSIAPAPSSPPRPSSPST